MSSQKRYEFGTFRVDVDERRLTRGGKPIPLRDKIFQTLLVLLENRGRLVSKDELMARVWPSVIVAESNLKHNISVLRDVLGDGENGERFIETIPKHGYRLVAAVTEVTGPPPPPPIRSSRRRYVWVAVFVAAAISCFFALKKIVAQPSLVRSVSVQPFTVRSDSTSDQYLGSAIADSVTARMRAHRQFTVQSSHAEASIQGQVQRAAGRIRATVQLIRTENGNVIWSGTFDGDLSNLFQLEDSIAAALASLPAFGVRGSEPTASRATADRRAHESYLKGRFFWNKRTAPDMRRAVEHFTTAIELDPNYAAAYAGLADAHNLLGQHELGKIAAMRALQLDDSLAAAHASLANVYFFWEWDWPAAEREFRRAIELDPSYPTAHHWYAFLLATRGRPAEALREIGIARDLDPLSAIITADVGQILFYAGRFDEAADAYKRALELDPHFVQAHFGLADTYQSRGMFRQAADEFEKVDSRRFPTEGAREYWGERAARQLDKSPFMRARVYAAARHFDEAMVELDAAYRRHEGPLVTLAVDPMFREMKDDPRYRALLAKVEHTSG